MQYPISEKKTFRAGEIIIREGEVSDEVYIVLKGKVEVFKKGVNKQEIILNIVSEGDVFGELGFILENPREVSARALTDIDVDIFDPRSFSLLYDLEIGRKMRPIIQSVAERLRVSYAKIADLGDCEKRVIEHKATELQKLISVQIIAENKKAMVSLNGLKSIGVERFPFTIGRFSRRRSDDLFHKNDLYLNDKAPFQISRSHCSLIKKNNKIFFQDRGSTLGSLVNGTQIGGKTSFSKKIELVAGNNTIQIGSSRSNLLFNFVLK